VEMAARQLENEAKLKILNALCDYPRTMKVSFPTLHRRYILLFFVAAHLLVVSFSCRMPYGH
jgi:hypothetical protein